MGVFVYFFANQVLEPKRTYGMTCTRFGEPKKCEFNRVGGGGQFFCWIFPRPARCPGSAAGQFDGLRNFIVSRNQVILSKLLRWGQWRLVLGELGQFWDRYWAYPACLRKLFSQVRALRALASWRVGVGGDCRRHMVFCAAKLDARTVASSIGSALLAIF